MNTNYIDELNESQYLAVTYIDGPSLVIAVAGSGKTRVLSIPFSHVFFVPKHNISDLLPNFLFMMQLIVKVYFVLLLKRWDWMRRLINLE